MPAPTDWITLAEAAEILAAANIHFTPATIGGWARAGRLQSIKLGGRRFVRRGEVRALSRRRGASGRRTSSQSCSRISGADASTSRWSQAVLAARPGAADDRRHPDGPRYLRSGGRRPAGQRTGLLRAVRRHPDVLLILGLAGWVGAGDPAIREEVSDALAAALPPLADLIRDSVEVGHATAPR